MSRHGTLTSRLPPPEPKPPEWLTNALISVVGVVLVLLLVFIGWPMLALVAAGTLFGLGVAVGYKGARSEDFTRNIERWLR